MPQGLLMPSRSIPVYGPDASDDRVLRGLLMPTSPFRECTDISPVIGRLQIGTRRDV
jgi:hypothetical protein